MDKLEELATKIAIRDKILEYSIAMDRCNKKVGYNIFTEDSVLNMGEVFQGSGKEFVDNCCRNHLMLECTNHWMPETYVVVVSDTEAHSMTYGGNFYNAFKDAQGLQWSGGSWCRYYDKWRKCPDGQWRIFYREVANEIFNAWPVNNNVPTRQGTRDASDIHYKFFPEHKPEE
jgi:hypothetical protein